MCDRVVFQSIHVLCCTQVSFRAALSYLSPRFWLFVAIGCASSAAVRLLSVCGFSALHCLILCMSWCVPR